MNEENIPIKRVYEDFEVTADTLRYYMKKFDVEYDIIHLKDVNYVSFSDYKKIEMVLNLAKEEKLEMVKLHDKYVALAHEQ